MPARPTNEPNNYFAFGFQTAKDTEATTFQFLRHLNGTAMEVVEQVEQHREGGDGQEAGLRYKTAVDSNGQAVINARPEVGMRFFAAALGADVVGGPQGVGSNASGVANEHIAVPTSKVPYLTIDQNWADEIERVTNVQVTQLDVEWETGRPLKITPQFTAGGSAYRRDQASVLTPIRETGAPFFYPGASVTIDGSANTKSTKGKITIKRTVEAVRTTGLTPEDAVALAIDVDVDATLKFENASALYDKIHYFDNLGAGLGSQIPINLATSNISIYSQLGSGTNIRYLQVGVNQMHLTGGRVNKLDPDGAVMYLDVVGAGYRGATYQVFARGLIASVAAIV